MAVQRGTLLQGAGVRQPRIMRLKCHDGVIFTVLCLRRAAVSEPHHGACNRNCVRS